VEDRSCRRSPADEVLPGEEGRLLEQIRSGDVEAGQQFVREHYAAIYRYLLYLTGQPDLAADLTQETFLQGWRYLDTFQGRGSLRAWLLRIARREFLRLMQRRQAELGSEEPGEFAAPDATAWMEAVELRGVIDRLPLEEREVLLLHYLEGYSSAEIAPIVGVPARTVRRRLAQAREHLWQELGEDDLTYLNESLAPMRQWAWLPLDQMYALEARLALGGDAEEDAMERREFLRQAAAGAAGLVLSESEKEIVDGRLTQKVKLAFKGMALSDLCAHLRTEIGVHVTAGASVADEKVTLFCKAMPLREVMRQLSRPFGYTWVRSGKTGEYRYELTQDLRSQLLEEELRNRDRNEALLALEREIERYRPYLGLSPDEALERSKTASPAEKKILENLGNKGWGPAQMYFQLTRADFEALRAGQIIQFASGPGPGEQALPPDVTRGVLQSWRVLRFYKRVGSFHMSRVDEATEKFPDALPPASTPEAGARVGLHLMQSELGQFTLEGSSGCYAGARAGERDVGNWSSTPLAIGRSPALLKPVNGASNTRLARDPALRALVTVAPPPSCRLSPADDTASKTASEPRVTSADVLAEIHQATGLPIVSDYYTRLYSPETVSIHGMPAFDALNSLADAMRLRWSKDPDGGWLQFRSASFFDDRLKEVPNRLLARWAAARRQHGVLTLDDLIDIAQLPDSQLDAKEMAEGARAIFGLAEWDVACSKAQRPHLRYLATFTPAQRLEAMSPACLPFTRMSLNQQQQFLAFSLPGDAEGLHSLDELDGATLRVDYSLPGWYEWRPGGWFQWVLPTADGRRVPRPPLRERTREAALQAARRYIPPFAQPMVKAMRSLTPGVTEAQMIPQETDVVPTTLRLQITYIPGSSHRHAIVTFHSGVDERRGTWEELGK
jgi:RNA polymerase sigma-70 factor, ECF subfamily